MNFAELSLAQKTVFNARAKVDLYFFTRYMFLARTNSLWLKNWHHKAICDAFNKVIEGKTKRLIIKVPPRYGKTELAKNFIAYSLGLFPDAKFIYTSYSTSLAVACSSQIREFMLLDAYKDLFKEVQLKFDTKAKNRWETSQGGGVYGVGFGGSITGFGAGLLREGFGGAILIDDPHKPLEVHSPILRKKVIDWYMETLQSRTNNPNTPVILIMQGLHEEDLSEFLKAGGSGEIWEELKLPAIGQDGKALWEAKHSLKDLERLKAANRYVFNSQYMQEPTNLGEGIIKSSWFKRFDILPRIKKAGIFIDTAMKTGKNNDYSVMLLAALGSDGAVYIIDLLRGKWEGWELENRVKDFYNKHKANFNGLKIYMEDKVSGTFLIQKIRMENNIPIAGVIPDKDKLTRVMGVQGYIESGYISLKDGANWLNDFLDECEKFSENDAHAHDDQVDCLVMAIQEFKNNKGAGIWQIV